jgi:rhamnosyltransferase
MRNNYHVAVLLATFNGQNFIAEQLESILLQKDVNLNLYVSDDGSNDNTLIILKQFQEKYGNFKIIQEKKNQSSGPANNFYFLINNVDFSKYDFVALSDQDDIWPEYKLSRAIDCITSSNAVGYSSDFINLYSNGKIKYYKKSNLQTDYDFLFETPGPGCSFVMTMSYAAKVKELLKQNPLLLNFRFHDWLIYAIARSHQLRWYIDDSPNLFYRQHKDNFIGSNTSLYGFYFRFSQILDGTWPDNIWFLYENLFKKYGKNLKLTKNNFFLYFLFRFWKSRRKFSHKILMILFLFMMCLRRDN